MPTKTITQPGPPTSAMGRNGTMKCSGIEVMPTNGPADGRHTVMLTPLTSRGNPGNCWIELTNECALELARYLIETLAGRSGAKPSGGEKLVERALANCGWPIT